jgi:16S rRNA (cytidine1402-2'-O)-methyltransferase
LSGKLYLIPVTLGGEDFMKVIPERVISLTKQLRVFIVEDLRSARRFLRLIDKKFPIDESTFFELNEHTVDSDTEHYLDPALAGTDTGIMSESGLPGIADPGARIIAMAHRKKITVAPLSGPSSILLALISSGLNGQNFAFNGYLPVKSGQRESMLREIEKKARHGYAQIFIETPYRNQKMLESILATCSNETKLCIAADISLNTETIKTMKISEWKRDLPDLNGKLVVFIIQ